MMNVLTVPPIALNINMPHRGENEGSVLREDFDVEMYVHI